MRTYLRHLDYMMLATALAITAYGLWILRNATRNDIPGDPTYYYNRQLAYAVVGVAGMLLISLVPPRFLRRINPLLYLFVVLSTMVVLVIGTSVQGGQRWINLGVFQFQPSELGKLLLIVGLAAWLGKRRDEWSPAQLTLGALAYMALPALLVFAEPDFGTALVYAAVTLGMLFVLGAPWRHFAWLGLGFVVALAMVFSIMPGLGVPIIKQYQMDRLTAFLHPNSSNIQGDGYHITQSMIAVGHGGVGGTGYAGATQTRLNYLPEHATDFIFSVVGEERGFVGAIWLLGLYALLIWRGLKVITISRSTFGSLVAAGIVSMLVFQIFINIGMTIGVAPITGIPLPFMSFGGTHTITNLFAIGVLQAIHVDAYRRAEPRLGGRGPAYG
jgi:rod shape determining protein RodA